MSAETKAEGALASLDDLERKYIIAQTAPAQGQPKGTEPTGWDASYTLWLSSIILVFGLIIFAIMAWLVARRHEHMAVLKVCALPLIIVSAIFLVIVGYSADQIAPVLGLLGSVAGYLLGSASKQAPDPAVPATKTPTGN